MKILENHPSRVSLSVAEGPLSMSGLTHPPLESLYRNLYAISYAVPQTAEVSLAIYTRDGRKVAPLFEGRQNAGTHVARWGTSDMPSGVYFARLAVDQEVASHKLVLTS